MPPPRVETVHFATNRNLVDEASGTFGDHYNPDGPYCVRYGSADVEVAADPMDDSYQVLSVHVAPERLRGRDSPTSQEEVLGSTEVFNGLRRRMKERKADLLVLIHGFDCTFELALRRAAMLKVLYSTPGRPLEVAVFAWPSDGRTFLPKISSGFRLAYFNDRTDAEASREALARALRRLISFLKNLPPDEACDGRLHLLAHSMGNYVLRWALQSFGRDHPSPLGMPRVFQNIFLMSADEDDDAFDTPLKFGRLHELGVHLHLYYALRDVALGISDATKGNADRLGTAGPRSLSNLPHRLTLVDCTDVSDVPGLADGFHQFYRARPEVVADAQAVLAGVRPNRIEHRELMEAQRAFRIIPQAERPRPAAARRPRRAAP